LAAYAAGDLPQGLALFVATHLALCPQCRRAVHAAETVAGLLLETESPVALDTGIRDLPPAAPDPRPDHVPFAGIRVPRPLRDHLPADLDRLAWRRVWFGVQEWPVPGMDCGARLMRITAGSRMPRHGHWGEEWTMVLQGRYDDCTGQYGPGDVQLGDPGLEHQPVAAPDAACVCLVATTGRLRLSGWLGRLTPWLGS
jgi:putative transcriptional regulator